MKMNNVTGMPNIFERCCRASRDSEYLHEVLSCLLKLLKHSTTLWGLISILLLPWLAFWVSRRMLENYFIKQSQIA